VIQRFYTPDEVAATLRVTRRAVYQWLKTGRLRGYRAGNRWRIRPEDVEALTRSDQHGGERTPETAAGRAARVDAAFGMFAGLPGSVAEFIRWKHQDTEWENQRWADQPE
jgi:excisionase family DNA binding protein